MRKASAQLQEGNIEQTENEGRSENLDRKDGARMVNDATLIEMMRNPQQRDEGYRQLMKQYGRKLYWTVRRIVVDHDDAEDALQDTAIAIYTNLDKFKGDSQLATWIYRIAVNQALAVLRRRTGIFQSIDSLNGELSEALTAQTDFDADEAQLTFEKALLTLPTQQRIAFNLRYFDEMSYDDISKVTGKSVTTLKTNYHYATERIKEYIKQHV